MTRNRRTLVAAAALASASVVALSPALAQWWNPFRREPPAQTAPQPLPPPPGLTGAPPAAQGGIFASPPPIAAIGPPPTAAIGAPMQLTLPPRDLVATPPPATPPPATPPGATPPAATAAVPAGVAPPVFAPSAGFGVPQTPETADAALRIERLEADLRTLTGQVEEANHRVQVLETEIARLGGTVPPREDAPAAIPVLTLPTPSAAITAAPPQQTILRPGAAAPSAATAPAATVPAAVAEAPARTVPGVPPAPTVFDLRFPRETAAITPTGDPNRDYAAAYNHVLSGDYDIAEIGFRAFLANYPDDQMAPDAQFWIGETLFTRGRFREAADEFLSGYNAYPSSAKRPETLLKLGQSLAGLGEVQTACETYGAVLRQFPQAPNAVRQQVQTEQASARCQ